MRMKTKHIVHNDKDQIKIKYKNEVQKNMLKLI